MYVVLDKSSKNDYERMTKTPVPQLILQLGIPTTISMLTTSFYNMADTAFVGTLGNSASGAVGIVFGFTAILQAFGFMYGHGSGNIAGRLLGQRDSLAASRIASTGFFLSFVTGLLISLLSFVFLEPLVRFLGSTETILPYAKEYLRTLLYAAPFMSAGFTLNNLLRYEGKARLAMIGLLSGAILNIAGDYLLVLVFKMGIWGAALATAVSQSISFLILLAVFLSGKTQLRLSARNIDLRLSTVSNIITAGAPTLIRQGISSVSSVVLNNQARLFGDVAIAAMSIVSRVGMFILSIGLGIGQGFQPVCAFNYGAQKPNRLKSAFSFTVIFSEIMLGALAVVGLVFAPQIVSVFRDDPEVIRFGADALRLNCIGLLFMPLSTVTEMMYQSTGKKKGAAILSTLKVQTILLFWFLPGRFGAWGLQAAQPVSYVISFVCAVAACAVFFKNLSADPYLQQ